MDRAAFPQVVVERPQVARVLEPEEHVDPRRLDVGVDDGDALAGGRQTHGQVGGQVRFAGPAAIRVNGNDLGHGAAASMTATQRV